MVPGEEAAGIEVDEEQREEEDPQEEDPPYMLNGTGPCAGKVAANIASLLHYPPNPTHSLLALCRTFCPSVPETNDP